MNTAQDKIEQFKDKFNKTLSRGDTYVDIDGNPIPDYETKEEKKNMSEEEETAALQKEMAEALPVDLSSPKFSRQQNIGDPKKADRSKNKLIMKPGQLGGKKKTKRRKSKKTKKRALKKDNRKSKRKKRSWCKSSNSWCKYTKKNNCKRGLWSKKTKLGRASRKWCKVTKKWCKVNNKTCKKRR
jgi:hypothetical protein